MSLNLTGLATGLVSGLGYAGVASGLIIDSLGIPIPSEILIPLATILAQQGRFNFWLVFIIGTLAQLTGALISYWIGRRGGLPAAERFGRYVLISPHDLALTHRVFARYGKFMVVAGRCVPVIRGLIG